MKLYDLLFESKDKPETFETFADTREAGAEKIANTAKSKGGLALLTGIISKLNWLIINERLLVSLS